MREVWTLTSPRVERHKHWSGPELELRCGHLNQTPELAVPTSLRLLRRLRLFMCLAPPGRTSAPARSARNYYFSQKQRAQAGERRVVEAVWTCTSLTTVAVIVRNVILEDTPPQSRG